MKIAHVVCVFPPYGGGIGKSALDFSIMMREGGHQVDVYAPLYTNDISEDDSNSTKIIRIKPILKLGNGAFVPRLFSKLKKYDLVYLHYPFFGGAEIIWFFKLFNRKTKVIFHYHMDVIGLSPLFKLLSFPSKMIEKSLLKKADLITAGSLDYIQNSQIKNFYTDNPGIFRETYFPVDTKKFHTRTDRGVREKKEILFVGGLDKAHYFKGLNVLIDALFLLRKRNDWILKVVGEGNLKQEYIKKCEEKKLSSRVEFLGSVSHEDLPIVYRESDFFVLPSINKGEAFGIVLLEAMASGLPIIASNLPGVRSVFTDKEGFLTKPSDREDLADKIKIFLDDDSLLTEMSESARRLSVDKYSYETISKRINSIVDEV
ncbi:MAG: glycosyltransferase family 4 protein [Patescibacteria group bacterium]|jgi:glycosyltransferase involved in cell wall biosynthesis|nr:glycosyltransferase family 4 protein [Patescibacteria group bacterium]